MAMSSDLMIRLGGCQKVVESGENEIALAKRNVS